MHVGLHTGYQAGTNLTGKANEWKNIKKKNHFKMTSIFRKTKHAHTYTHVFIHIYTIHCTRTRRRKKNCKKENSLPC